MADQLQLRRGSAAQNLAFTGAQGEVTVDTTTNTLVVHNGVTAGGFRMATSSQLTEGTFYYNEDVGSSPNAYLLTPKANTNAPSTYQDGIQFGFVTVNDNTGPSTANFQGLGVKSLKYPGGVDPLAGEIFGRVYLIYDATNDWMEIQRKALGPPPQIRSVAGSVGSNALTATLNPCVIDFRASSLGSGSVTTRSITAPITVTAPAGATLGTVSATASRLVILVILGPVNAELALVNLAGSVNLDETTLINTTAITSGSNLANVVYSTTARSGVPFRVVGFIDSTQTTAGTWATVPSTVQGAGGQALAAMASIGYGQSWVDMTASRAPGVTYTNTTGKPIFAFMRAASSMASSAIIATVNGVQMIGMTQPTSTLGASNTIMVPPGATYSFILNSGTHSAVSWQELR